jgi:outer membrane immunogenic protein
MKIGIAAAALFFIAAPVNAFAQSDRWDGFYFGGTVGYGWGNADSNMTGNGANQSFPGSPLAIHNSNAFQLSTRNTTSLDGAIAGGQIGFNYQFGPTLLLGLETDLQASNRSASAAINSPTEGRICTGSAIGPPVNCIFTDNLIGTTAIETTAKIDWFGTARARLGFIARNELLFYATGGLAYGRVTASGNTRVSATLLGWPFAGASGFSTSETKLGYALGGGIEGRFASWLPSNWSWKLEYMHVDLGSVHQSSPIAITSGLVAVGTINGSIQTRTRITDNIVRVGVNYRF